MNQAKLDAALAWARRGFRIFPLIPGKKKPAVKGFSAVATTDEDLINLWWSAEDYNIGVDTTGMVVVDVDVKEGKRGIESFTALGLQWDTLTVATPSGGYHAYYIGPDSRSQVEVMGSGLDLRSHHGYVVAPGSVTEDGVYEVVLDQPMVDVPSPVSRYLEEPRQRESGLAEHVEWDTEVNVAACIGYLQWAPAAVEMRGGNNQTYEVAAYCRDFGVSPHKISELMDKYYNPRCSPPWTRPELDHIVGNAWEYGSGVCGKLSPTQLLHGVSVPTPKEILHAEAAIGFGNVVAAEMIEPRPWVMSRLLMLRQITLLTAAGGAGKSTFAMTLAVHLAAGLDFLGLKIHKPGKSILYNAEDDRTEASRKLYACCAQYGIDFYQVKDKIALIGRDELNVKLTRGQRPPVINAEHVEYLTQLASDPEVVMLGLDPLVRIQTGHEDDNVEMDVVMDIMTGVARDANVAMLLAHHTSKGSSSIDNAGSATAQRGAGAISAACRISVTLFGASKEDCQQFHIPEKDIHKFVRLDDAKANLALMTGEPIWMEKVSSTLMNGDQVGVLMPVSLTETAQQAVAQIGRMLLGRMTHDGKAAIPITEAAQIVMTEHSLYAKLPINTVKQRIEHMFQGNGVALDHGRGIRALRDTDKASAPLMVVMC